MKIKSIIFATAISMVPAMSHAGIPVIDGASLAQAINQVMAWQQQYTQMVEQLKQQAEQIAATTGNRGLANIYNNMDLQKVVPSNTQEIYNAINQYGSHGLTGAAQAIRSATQVYNCEDLTGETQKLCLGAMNGNAQTLANLNDALAKVSGRTSQIQQIQNAIATTSDPKAIAELQARLQAEAAQVTNDQNRISLMVAMAKGQQDELIRRSNELRLQRSARPVNVTAQPFLLP